MANLDKQIKYFDENIDILLKEYEGAFLVISESLKVDAFGTLGEAYTFGSSAYGSGNFLLRECRKDNVNKVIRITPRIAFA